MFYAFDVHLQSLYNTKGAAREVGTRIQRDEFHSTEVHLRGSPWRLLAQQMLHVIYIYMYTK